MPKCCNDKPVSPLQPGERLIFPLDLPGWAPAARLVDALKDHVGYFKVGLELFTREGPDVVRRLRETTGDRARVFLDLKLHDIPATVSRAMAAVRDLAVDLVTVHATGGPEMLRAAKEAAGKTRVLAVTVLTSIDLNRRPLIWNPAYRQPGLLVRRLAGDALEAGVDGLVCSGQEVDVLRRTFGPEPLLVVPGIRPAWSLVAGDDQKRVVTPEKAIRAGADLLVVGRPIRDAADPARAAALVADEIRAGLDHPGD